MNNNLAVELRGICKTYPGCAVKANDNISLDLRRGEILCIAGENGAGKTTLMNILGGLETPSSGDIKINGETVTINSPLAARKFGIGMAHQRFMLFPEYTVAQNIVMGMEPRKWGMFFDRKKAVADAAQVINAHHFSIDPEQIVRSLSAGEMQQTEICRLLYRKADIIILDEPTAVLTDHEITALFKTLKALAAAGKSIFLITHKLREIQLIADRVAVLCRGCLAGIRDAADKYEIARLMSCSASPALTLQKKDGRKKAKDTDGKAVIAFNNVTVLRRGQKRPLLDNISFSVAQGRIAGFAGVGGNGLGALEAALGGFLHPASGTIAHKGKDISRLNIRRLRNQGLAYIPADRRGVGSAPSAAIDENMILNRRREFSRMGFLDAKAVRNFYDSLTESYQIAGPGCRFPAEALSGGNLQKLILAREINQFKSYFVFSEPTGGLDIAAGHAVWNEIAALRDKGAAIILISTNLDEILALADTIFVMYRGRIAAEFPNTASDTAVPGADSLREKIARAMQGLTV